MTSPIPESIRIRAALQDIAAEIERRRVTVTTRSPNARFPNGYQEVKRGDAIGVIGMQGAAPQVTRTGSFGG